VSVEKEGFELISIGGETLGVGSNERIREVVRRLRDGFWVWTVKPWVLKLILTCFKSKLIYFFNFKKNIKKNIFEKIK
jgi:hypothetical protein